MVLGIIPIWVCILMWVVTRTSLAGAGHYYIHRKKHYTKKGHFHFVRNMAHSLFDMNYVGGCLTATDGHVMVHHPYLMTGADVKKGFFGGMLKLPRWLRLPGYTLHKFGTFLTGMQIRGYEINFFEREKDSIRGEFWLMRLLMLAEFAVCAWFGLLWVWMIQFVITLWYNTFLVTSSHDYEDKADENDDKPIMMLPPALQHDWAACQIQLSHDLTISGNRWVDVFLSAGLSPHRVHHVIPNQKSGFSNLLSEASVRSVCEDAGMTWARPQNFFWDRLPKMIRDYLLSDPRDPTTGVKTNPGLGLRACFQYVVTGFRGFGAI